MSARAAWRCGCTAVAVRLHLQPHLFTRTDARPRTGVTKTHKLTFEAQAGLWPNAAASSVNHLQIGARVVAELLEHFSNKNGGEVTFWCAPTFLVVRSKSEDVMEKSERLPWACLDVMGAHSAATQTTSAARFRRTSRSSSTRLRCSK